MFLNKIIKITPTAYSSPAKPNINIAEDSNVMSSLVTLHINTKVYKITQTISDKNNNLKKLFKLLIKEIKLNQNNNDQKFIHDCMEFISSGINITVINFNQK